MESGSDPDPGRHNRLARNMHCISVGLKFRTLPTTGTSLRRTSLLLVVINCNMTFLRYSSVASQPRFSCNEVYEKPLSSDTRPPIRGPVDCLSNAARPILRASRIMRCCSSTLLFFSRSCMLRLDTSVSANLFAALVFACWSCSSSSLMRCVRGCCASSSICSNDCRAEVMAMRCLFSSSAIASACSCFNASASAEQDCLVFRFSCCALVSSL
mmetsp:Transcript_23100/g.41608  ORF Transcript_23100/g.41608 Transcript_23100/m.41608 type:complete len:213 (-) Transcript_23100:1000-1638(-)